jgi:hypothetical protein
MQVMETIIAHNRTHEWVNLSNVLTMLAGCVVKMFGCWHLDMSRPFSQAGETYRACTGCGARRHFDVQRWEMQGRYYFNSPGAAGGETHARWQTAE